MMMKILRGILLVCISVILAGCGTMNYYDGPKRSDAEVAEVYLQGTGGWPLIMYKIDGEEHPFGFLKKVAYVPPGEHVFRYHSDETDFGDQALTAFVAFSVDLKPGYSYFVVANSDPDPDSDSETACIFEELRNDPAARTDPLNPRKPQDKTKPLQCDSFDWRVWK
jgi:hypothetical protein